VTLNATAASSSVSITNTYYTVDGGAQQTYASPFTVSGSGSHTITYWSTDNSGLQEAANTKTFTVHTNLPPSIASFTGGTINEAGTYTASGSFSDYDSSSWTATVDYGDGSGAQSVSLSAMNFSLSHVYKDEGTYTVTVKVTDNQGATGTATATVTVNNAPFTVSAITAPAPVQLVNGTASVTVSATFADPGVLDTHTATWDWGDGTTTTCPANTSSCTLTEMNGSGPGTVTASHTYTAAAVYPVTLTITDDDGVAVTPAMPQPVSIYNATSQGLFTAGDWFTSPAGAYPQNPSLTGKVTFGLNYGYTGSVPNGRKQFYMTFGNANLTFNATSVASLVVDNNNMATLTGSGTINNAGNYNFVVTGVDNGGIRIQITDPSNNNKVIYDTQPGAAITATPTTAVTGKVSAHP
jgi:large repetitive protein